MSSRSSKGPSAPRSSTSAALYKDTGAFTYDPGFTSTASCEFEITFIDGDEGILLHRGYPIDQLAEHGDFLEVCYLLLYGELPTKAQKDDFDYRVTRHTMVHEQMSRFFTGFRRDAHPMAVMCGVVGALSAFYHDSTDISDPYQRMIASMRLIAKMPTIAAMAYKYHIGQPFVYPKNDLDYRGELPAHVLCGAVRGIQGQSGAGARHGPHLHPARRPRAERLDLDGAAGRLVGRQPVRLHRGRHRLPVGPGAWRRQRGGAQHAVARSARVDRIPEFIARAKDKNDPFRLMGFGHRVYKNYDPRAKIMQKTTHEVLGELGIKDDPLLDVAMELEKIALTDDYFIEKKLYPNVDFYSGITLKALGFPTTMFTVLFAVARTVGWIAQWKEMIEDPQPEDRPSAPALHRRRRSATTCRSPSARAGRAGGSGLTAGPCPAYERVGDSRAREREALDVAAYQRLRRRGHWHLSPIASLAADRTTPAPGWHSREWRGPVCSPASVAALRVYFRVRTLGQIVSLKRGGIAASLAYLVLLVLSTALASPPLESILRDVMDGLDLAVHPSSTQHRRRRNYRTNPGRAFHTARRWTVASWPTSWPGSRRPSSRYRHRPSVRPGNGAGQGCPSRDCHRNR